MKVHHFIVVVFLISLASAKIGVDENIKHALDTNLFERVLDAEQCEKQLDYLQRNATLLLAQFIDAGLRVPRGIFLGNLRDHGHYAQCLSIHELVHDMSIEGKYCLIKVPANQNLRTELLQGVKMNFNPNMLELDEKTANKLKERSAYMKTIANTFGGNIINSRMDSDSPLMNLDFHLALCIPKVCTTQEALNALLFNIETLGFKYEDEFCRLPNDRPWASVDYVATVVFSILGVLTLLSTGYDIHHNIIRKKDPKEASVVCMSFSAFTNCRRLLSFKVNPNVIQCLDGIRALATFWVVIGHVFFIINFFTANPIAAFEWAQSYVSMWIMTATLTVDTFFLLSGLLLVYTTAGKLTANQLIKSLPIFYLNRLLRMFPVLAAVILFEASFYNRLGDGPIWDMVLLNVQKCRTFWWTTLLHVQNFVNPQDTCLGVTWYLAIDTNLHILSPFILFFVLGRRRKIAITALSISLFVVMSASLGYIFATEFTDYYVEFYVNILTRAPPFFIGLLYGYLLNVWRGRRLKMPVIIGLFITALSIVLIASIIYLKFMQDQVEFVDKKRVQDTLDGLLRPAWSLGLGWIIFACVHGYSGPINWFLSLNVWKIPSRISYAMYLTHISFMMSYYSSSLQPVYFTVPIAMFDFMAFFSIVIMTSFFITVLIDAPFAILFKLILGYGSKRTVAKQKIKEEDENNNVSEDIEYSNKEIDNK